MKPKATLRHFLAIAGSSIMAVSSASAQTNLFWDANGDTTTATGGAGTWNTSNTWRSGSSTGPLGDWADGNAAVFGGTAGTVTLSAPVSTTGLTFSVASYVITGSTITLTGTPAIGIASGAATLTSAISGVNGLEKTGAGVLLLNSTTSSYSGGTVITGGRLNAASDAALGNSTGSITLNGGTLGANTSTGTGRQNGTNLVTARDVIVGASGGGIFVSKNNNFTTTGALSGSGAFTTANPGGSGGIPIYRFSSSANTFTGSMSLNTADVRVSSLGDTAGNNIVFTTADSSFRFNDTGAAAGLTFNNRAFELSNVGATIDNLNTTHAFTINSNLVATGAAAKTLTLNSAAGPTNTFAGIIADKTDGGSGTVALTKSGAGTWTLSGNNSYTGITTISDGRLEIGGSGTLGHVSAGVGNYAGNISIASTSSGRLVHNSSATQTLGGVISGAGALFVENGTLTLTNDNTYTGATNVNAGTLLINGSTSSTSLVTVNSGGTLGGTGTIGGSVTLNEGASLSPGASIESLATGSNVWNGGSTIVFELSTDGSNGTAGVQWDLLAITGTLGFGDASDTNRINLDLVTLLNATTTGSLQAWNPNADALWAGFVTTTGGITGFAADLFDIDTTSFQNPINGSFSIAQSGNNLDLIYTAIPEPRAALLGGLGLLALLRRRRV